MKKNLWIAGAAAAALALNAYRSHRALQRLRGLTVLITGGSRGLGLCFARQLADLDCRLVLCARNPEELDRAASELSGPILPVVCDVTRPEEVADMLSDARRHFGPIDLLINNAGIIVVGPLESMTLQQYRDCLDVMFWGTVYPTLGVLPEMRQRGGRILNVTSIGGRVSVPHLLPYCCAKAAAVAFSEGLRQATVGTKVNVLTAVPGLMRTGSYGNAFFRGPARREYAWFSYTANAPGVTIDPVRAARQMLRALAENRAEHHVTLAADLLARLHGLMPGLVADLMGLASFWMPQGADGPTREGDELAREMPRWLDRLNLLGRLARRDLQRHKTKGEPSHV